MEILIDRRAEGMLHGMRYPITWEFVLPFPGLQLFGITLQDLQKFNQISILSLCV
jgi:hypothetical protein